MQTSVDADYLVVGAGAMGLAFTDALVDHSDARVMIVDRRDGVGGHWREAYPFVRLHVASAFYGVASTLLGGSLQESGPEAGLYERASQPEVLAYFQDVLARLETTGRVRFLRRSEYADGVVVRLGSGERLAVPESCRVVDARYLSPTIPAEVPPSFYVGDGVRVMPVNDLVELEDAPSQYVIVGSGKTATDADRLATRQGHGSRFGPLGPAPRPLDVQPRAASARPRRLPGHGRRPVGVRRDRLVGR